MDKPTMLQTLQHYGASHVPEGSRWLRIKCVFHEDRTPSASVNTEGNKYKCFTCDIHGDSLDLIAWKEGTVGDFARTLEIAEGLFERGYGNVLPAERTGQRKRRVPFADTGPHDKQRSVFQARVRRKPFAGA